MFLLVCGGQDILFAIKVTLDERLVFDVTERQSLCSNLFYYFNHEQAVVMTLFQYMLSKEDLKYKSIDAF